MLNGIVCEWHNLGMPWLENINEGHFLLSPAPSPSLISQTPLTHSFCVKGVWLARLYTPLLIQVGNKNILMWATPFMLVQFWRREWGIWVGWSKCSSDLQGEGHLAWWISSVWWQYHYSGTTINFMHILWRHSHKRLLPLAQHSSSLLSTLVINVCDFHVYM